MFAKCRKNQWCSGLVTCLIPTFALHTLPYSSTVTQQPFCTPICFPKEIGNPKFHNCHSTSKSWRKSQDIREEMLFEINSLGQSRRFWGDLGVKKEKITNFCPNTRQLRKPGSRTRDSISGIPLLPRHAFPTPPPLRSSFSGACRLLPNNYRRQADRVGSM